MLFLIEPTRLPSAAVLGQQPDATADGVFRGPISLSAQRRRFTRQGAVIDPKEAVDQPGAPPSDRQYQESRVQLEVTSSNVARDLAGQAQFHVQDDLSVLLARSGNRLRNPAHHHGDDLLSFNLRWAPCGLFSVSKTVTVSTAARPPGSCARYRSKSPLCLSSRRMAIWTTVFR
jgi:hypothetical protein